MSYSKSNSPHSPSQVPDTARILIVDDDEQLSDILELVLEGEGYGFRSVRDGASALQALRDEDFSLVLLDLRLADESGLDILREIREIRASLPVLMITAHGDMDSAITAFTRGATGFIRKPFQDGDLRLQVRQAIDRFRAQLDARNVSELRPRSNALKVRELIPTRDPAMEEVIKMTEIASHALSSVVIQGESGTGKELVARALHQAGPRAQGPFIAFNCAALPETLAEAELFGYMRGAFTDARADKPGLFARANGGTLFLDEVADAPLALQAKLLRVIQERELMPLGGTVPVKLDVRLICATQRPLRDAVDAGKFRSDLFYRLNVVPLRVPALRERPRDVAFLSNLFANRIARELGCVFEGFTPGGEDALLAHHWPGNVRELQNRIEHALVLSRGSPQGGAILNAFSLFPEKGESAGNAMESARESQKSQDSQDSLPTFGEAKKDFERSYLERVLRAAQGNIARAARLASKSRTEVYSLLRKHGLDPRGFKGRGGDLG